VSLERFGRAHSKTYSSCVFEHFLTLWHMQHADNAYLVCLKQADKSSVLYVAAYIWMQFPSFLQATRRQSLFGLHAISHDFVTNAWAVATFRNAALMTGLLAVFATPSTSYKVSGTAAKNRQACNVPHCCCRKSCRDRELIRMSRTTFLPCIAG